VNTSKRENLSKLFFLQSLDGIGTSRILNLLSKFKSIDNAVNAEYSELIQTGSISTKIAQNIVSARERFAIVEIEFEKQTEILKKIGGKIISYWDEDYPELLKRIYSPPLLIYIIGDFTEKDKYSMSVVGTRRPTQYGIHQTEEIVKGLLDYDLTIVSGMARGIDTVAHKTAVKSGGRTIAVIGSGLDVIYPPENNHLFNKIIENGIIVSEFKCGTKPDAPNFPKRNRIISGLTLGTLVVESKLTGGALQTASHALDQNREVFAIPGNISTSQSEGCNKLIQKGEAKLVTSAEDILIELDLLLKPAIGKNIPKPSVELSLFEENVVSCLSETPRNIDDLAEDLSMSTSECLVHLLSLEFKGMVVQLPGKSFKLL
jgi:DNA processing protein